MDTKSLTKVAIALIKMYGEEEGCKLLCEICRNIITYGYTPYTYNDNAWTYNNNTWGSGK